MLRNILVLGAAALPLAVGFAPSSVLPSKNFMRAATISHTPLVSLRTAAGAIPLRMVASSDVKPMPVRSKLREEAAFMMPKDDMSIKDRVAKYVADGELTKADDFPDHAVFDRSLGPPEFILMNWMENYSEALAKSGATDEQKSFNVQEYFTVLVELVRKERKRPHYFSAEDVTGTHFERKDAHKDDTPFFPYQEIGIDFTRPLIDYESTKIVGIENLERIKEQLAKGDNVVFLSNHQSESDTHCIFSLFEDKLGEEFGKIGKDIVFMAGERVLRDAIVVPFSRGCNLLTVYSKKHIDSEPELKTAKMGHNQRTMKKLGELFHVGGTCMWFAPSGGRDRRGADGKVELSPFDPNAIEMVRLVAEGAGAGGKTHFYPMSLMTHNIFPPPSSVGGEFGEERKVNWTQLGLAVGAEVTEERQSSTLTGAEAKRAQKAARAERARKLFEEMEEGYTAIGGYEQ